MEFIPAIDLIEGQCVRLVQGDFSRRITYGDPIDAAVEIEGHGAGWLHLVDLDAARSISGPNREVIRDICAGTQMNIEVGGGVRSLKDAVDLFEIGVSRVIVGTMAVTDPDLISAIAGENSGGVAVGLDYRKMGKNREVAVRGWLEGSGVDLFEILPPLVERGATAVVSTDISRDGTFAGPDTVTLLALLSMDFPPSFDVIASGGIAGIDDLESLKRLEVNGRRLFGAISGRAIHDGRLNVKDAVELCRA